MPMYGLPAGLTAFLGAGSGQPGFGGAFGGALQAFGQAEAAQAQQGDRQFDQMLKFARLQQEVKAAEYEREQQRQAQGQLLAQQAQKEELRAQLRPELRELADVDMATAIKLQYPKPQEATALFRNLSAAGLHPGTPEFQQAMLQAVNKPQVTINQPKLEPGYAPVDPNDLTKGVVPIPGSTKDPLNPKNFTGEQRKAAGFADRLFKAQGKIRTMEDAGYNPGTLGEVARGRFGRPAQSKDAKAYQDYQDEFIRAILRKESGAAISAEERADYGAYFPQLGDTAEDITRKAAIRDELAGGVRAEAGPAYEHLQGQAMQQRAKSLGVSMTDVEYTAQQEGMTVQQVLDELER